MRKLLLGLIMLMSISAFAQTPQLTWELRNPQIVSGTADSLQFEVWVQADMTGFFFSLHTFSMDYPADRFGSNAWDNDPLVSRMSVQRGALLTGEFSSIYFYNVLGTANTFPNTFSASIQSNFNAFPPNASWHTEMPTTFGHFFTITIEIVDNAGVADIDFAEWLMNGQQFYHIAGGPTSAEACIDPNLYSATNPLLLYPLGGGGGVATWTGATNGDWFNVLNWDGGSVPTATDDVSIPAGTLNDPDIYFTVDHAECQNMDIEAGARLRIGNAANLSVNGTLTNEGEMIMYGTVRGASLLEEGLAGNGTFTYERTLTSGAPGSHFGWHYVSSPVDNTVTGDFVGYWVKSWGEAGNTFTDIDPWVDCANPSAFNVAMNAGQGYSVKQDLDYTGTSPCPEPTGVIGDVVIFGGDYLTGTAYGAGYTELATMANVNTGAYSLDFTAGGSNWNLLGNPYPSGINWDAVTVPAGLNNAVYFWDEDMDQYATYIDGVGANNGTNEIPPTQAFFVEATASGSLALDNTMRTHSGADYYKSEVNDILRLVATANNFTDETVIRFTEEATTGFDKQYDAKKLLSGGSEVPSLYTHAGNSIISINSQQATELVPMAFTCSLSGTYTIEAVETSDFSEVTLEDLVTGEETDLLTSDYTFDYTAGENADRFIVHFGALGTIENNFDNVSIWSNENNIYVNVPMVTSGEIVVVNMMGQEIIRTDIANGINVIPINDVNSYYIVKVIGSEAVKTGKVYIK